MMHNLCVLVDNPNNVTFIHKAIIQLINLLKYCDNEIEAAKKLNPLYLPTFDYALVLSTNLVYCDSTQYNNVCLNFSNSKYSLFQIPQNSTTNKITHTEKDVCLLLPQSVRPQGLSMISKEVPISYDGGAKESKLVSHFQNLQRVCSLDHCNDGLLQAIIVSSEITCEQAEAITTALIFLVKNLKLVTIHKLTTSVSLENVTIGLLKVDFLLQSFDRHFILYVDEDVTKIGRSLWKDVAQRFCIEIANLNDVLNQGCCLNCVGVVSEYLAVQSDEDFVVQINPKSINYINQIVLGAPISNKWIPYLDNDINNIFCPQEWVGYEVSEDSFIWAVVMYAVKQYNPNTLMNEYQIQIKEEEAIVVLGLCMYKLLSKEQYHYQSESQLDVVLNLSTGGTSTSSDEVHTDMKKKLRKVKFKICEELKMVWILSNIDQQRALRRVYYGYHLDKADTSEVAIYEESFKFLKQQIQRLENNLPLNDIDDKVSETQTVWNNYFSHWNYNTSRRIRPQKEKEETHDSGARASCGSFNFQQPCKNSEEANRWIKQAESDLMALNTLYDVVYSKSCVSSYIVFMAHQVMEKSLKAGMYSWIGLNPITNHYLSSHAIALGSVNPSLANLENLVCNMESHYLDANKHPLPLAPVDKYTPQQAEVIRSNAQKVYDLIKNVL